MPLCERILVKGVAKVWAAVSPRSEHPELLPPATQ